MTTKRLRQRLWERFILHRLGEWCAIVFLLIATTPLMMGGDITFSDLAVGKVSDDYLNFILGVFNERLGTPNWFNLPRLLWIMPAYFVSLLFQSDGNAFVVSLIYGIMAVSVFSFGSLLRRLSNRRSIPIGNFSIFLGCIFYALNPWVIIRIQHIFLLCGYALVPLGLSWTWRVLGRESWDHEEHPFTIRPTLSELRYHLTLGLIVSASFAGIHFGIYIVLCMAGMGVLFAARAFPKAYRMRLKLRWFGWFFTRAVLAGGCFILFATYWMLPFVMSIIKGVRPSQNNVNVVETVATFSRASTLENIAFGLSYWWPMFEHRDLPVSVWYAGYILIFVVFLGILYSRRYLIGLAIGLLFIVSSGTYFHPMASTYISMVFDTPYPFGDMIRDPNKLYGVSALPLALCFAWGAEYLRRFKYKSLPLLQWESAIFIVLWIYPIYKVFFLGFYFPVEWPEEYEQMQEEFSRISAEHNGDIKILYLPVSDFALDKRLGYTSPDFNEIELFGETHKKSTGDHVVFDTRHDTLFPFEGNDINVLYFLLYFHHLMDEEDLEHVGALASKAGITHILMRQDYSVWEERFQHYKDVLDAQTDLSEVWTNGMMTIYEVQNVQADAEAMHHLIYSAGGLERMTWYPRMFNTSSKQFNILFPYSSHFQKLDILREGDAVETTNFADLALIQLPEDRFIYAGDNIKTASPHLRWSKVVVSGHDWQYISKIHQIRNDQFNFDMGKGVAFTNTPISVPPEAYITPKVGPDLLVEHMSKGASWFTPYEDMDILATDLTIEKPQSFRVIAPDDGVDAPVDEEEAHDWRVLQSETFDIKSQNLYQISCKMPRIHNIDIELRVAMYSKEGHLLGTAPAEIRTTIPEPLMGERKKSFLTPKDTHHARLEVHVRNRRPGLLEFEVHDVHLYDLKTFSDPNKLPLQLKERSGEQDGKLWMRFICSNQGGSVGLHLRNTITDETWMETIDTKCIETAHFTWKYVDTPAGLDRNFEIENLTGTNAINALVWTSHEEYIQLIDKLERELSDKVLFHIVDSSMFKVDQALSSHDPNAKLVSGTMMHSLNGSLSTSVDIVHDASYNFSVQDYLPNDTDGYQVQIWRRRDDTRTALVFEDTVRATDTNRIDEGNDISTTDIATLSLSPGQYDIGIQFNSEHPVIFTEQNFDDTESDLIKNPVEQTITRVIPPQSGTWASISSDAIPVSHEQALMMWYKVHVHNGREFHAKLLYFDEHMNQLKITYIQGKNDRNPGFTTVQQYIEPPENAHYMQIQFLAKQTLIEHEDANFTLKDLRLWEMDSSPAIDALLFTREPGLNLENSPATINVVKKKSGKRDILVSNPVSLDERAFTRFQLYESPIRHWDFFYNSIEIEGFAVNGIGFGVNVPVNNAIIYAEVPLNRIWKYGLVVGLFGFMLLGLFSSIKLLRKIQERIKRTSE